MWNLLTRQKQNESQRTPISLEEFLIQAQENNELPLSYDPQPRDILLHGHCHQRALSGIQPIQQMLELPPTHMSLSLIPVVVEWQVHSDMKNHITKYL